MVKLLFSFLLACIPFCASSQDSTVCLPTEAARYYMVADDERWALREKDSLQTLLISNQNEEILVRDQKIVTYQNDSASYATRDQTFSSEIRILEDERDHAEKALKLRKALEVLSLIGLIIASIL